jgi:hypothetical protein
MSQKRCFAEMTRHQLWSIKQQEQLTNLDACWRNTWRYLTTNDRYWWLMDLFSSKYTNANSDGMNRLAMMTVMMMMMMILVLMHVSNQRPPINQSINQCSISIEPQELSILLEARQDRRCHSSSLEAAIELFRNRPLLGQCHVPSTTDDGRAQEAQAGATARGGASSVGRAVWHC